MSQKAYVDRVVERFGLSEFKPSFIPADMKPLVKSDGMNVTKYPYREAAGSMMYLMLCTHPDIANAVGCLAKYCDAYDVSHGTAVKRIQQYLRASHEELLP